MIGSDTLGATDRKSEKIMLPIIEFRGKTYKKRVAQANGVTLQGTQASEWFETLGGNNTVIGGKSDNVVLAGVDFLAIGNNPVFGPDAIGWKLRSDAGNNTVTTQGGNDYVITGSGNDVVSLGQGDNIYDGRAGGSDTVSAGEGNDFIVLTVDGTTTVNMGGGNNFISFGGGTDAKLGVLTVKATQGSDFLQWTGGVIQSLDADLGSGENYLQVSGLNLTLKTGKDADQFKVAGLNITIASGAGDDDIQVSGTTINMDADTGNNQIELFGATQAIVKAAQGNDNLSASFVANIQAYLGDGNNRLTVTYSQSAILTTGSGNDEIETNIWGDRPDITTRIDAGNGDNKITFNLDRPSGDNSIRSGFGNDVINAVTNASTLNSATIDAGDGDNIVTVKGAAKVITGAGADTITVNSDKLPSQINSGEGNDAIQFKLTNGEAYGLVNAGNGDNKLTISGNINVVTGSGADQITITDANKIIVQSAAGDDVINFTARESATGLSTFDSGDGNDVINAIGDARVGGIIVQAGEGNNTVTASSYDNRITSGSGNDVLQVSGFMSMVNSGGGDDRVSSVARSSSINLGSGNNRAMVRGFFTTISAGNGDDLLSGVGNVVTINASEGQNQIYASGGGLTRITAGNGNDVVYIEGTIRELIVNAGNGNNIVYLGPRVTSDTTIIGGTGDDIFSLGESTSSRLVIQGYGKNDKILLADLAGVTVNQVDQNVQILRGSRIEATVTNTKASDINLSVGATQVASDFLKDPFNVKMPIAALANTELQ